MKFSMKVLVILVLLIPSAKIFANESEISFYVGCSPVSDDCIELQYASKIEGKMMVQPSPVLTLNRSDISHAEFVASEFGPKQLQLRLERQAAEQFAQVTGSVIGKQLAVVANGKIIVAPMIQEPITSGGFVVTAGFNSSDDFLNEIPWLKKMAEDKTESRENWSLVLIISFIAIGLLLILGTIYFAFFRKQKSI